MASETIKSPGSIRLGSDLELDVGAYELRRSGRRLKLERIPMELLLLLVEQRGQLVTREEIIRKIWGEDVYLATDSSINAAVRKVRQALKDDPDHPRFVQTISGKGYRFIGPMLDAAPPVEDEVAAVPVSAVESPVPLPSSKDRSTWSRARWSSILAVAIVLIAAIGIYLARFAVHPRSSRSGDRLMLAVLPFENLTGDANQEYFSDGLTEEMISQVGNLDPQHLGVIARTSVMYYKNHSPQLQQVAHDLGVQYVLEGSVRRDGGKVRVTAQLIQLKDLTHLWARQYDRELSDLLTLQGEIAHEIADEIRLTLGDGHESVQNAARITLTPQQYEAYDLYLKGQYFWNKRTAQSLQQAIEYFQKAIAKDPNYARAHAGLADSYALISGYNSSVTSKIMMPKARAAAVRAIQLDERSAEAHTALAVVAQDYDFDWQTAEREYRRAIQLNPNYATAHHWYGEYLGLQGRFDEAFREFDRARQLDPLSLIIAADYGEVLYYARQHDRSIAQFHAVLEMESNFPRAYNVLGPYSEKGMFPEALAQLEAWDRSSREDSWRTAWLAYVYGRSGDQPRARRAIDELERLNGRQHLDPAPMIVAYIGTGNNQEALSWLEKAYDEHSPSLTCLKVSPLFDPLRSEPRFQSVLRRMGFAS